MDTIGNRDALAHFLQYEVGQDLCTALAAMQVVHTVTNKMAGMEVTVENADEMLRTFVLAAHVELDELLQEFNWKPWKKTKKPIDNDKVMKEFGDLLAFIGAIITVLNVHGLRSFALAQGYVNVEVENIRRFEGDY